MGKYFVHKFEAEPYPDSTRVVIKGSGLPCIIEGLCPCTSTLLHYLARLDDGSVISVQHLDVVPVESLAASELPY